MTDALLNAIREAQRQREDRLWASGKPATQAQLLALQRRFNKRNKRKEKST